MFSFYNQLFFNKNMIALTHPQDIMFADIAQGAIVTAAILPSGLKVPKDGIWKIKGHNLVKEPMSGQQAQHNPNREDVSEKKI